MTTTFKKTKNFAGGYLASGISASTSSLPLASGQGASFPASGSFFVLVYDASPDNSAEIVLVGGRSGDTLTGCTRGQQGTTGTIFSAGAKVQIVWTAEEIEDIHDAINALEGASGYALPALTSGSVIYYNGSDLAQENSKLFWDATNDRLGIGTATPDSPLEVFRSDALGLESVKLSQGSTGDSTIHFSLESSTSWTLGIDNSDGDAFKITPLAVLGLADSAITILTNRRIGIGLDSPSARVHVALDSGSVNSDLTGADYIAAVFSNTSASGDHCIIALQGGTNANVGIRMGDNSGNSFDGYIGFQTSSRYLHFNTASVEHMRIDSNGSTGINASGAISAPNTSAVLDLQGTKALLLPRLTTTERNALTATAGMMIWNTTDSQPNWHDGSSWGDIPYFA